MAITILIALAGLMGAAGIVLAAAGAHVAPGAGLDSAASMLLFHAAAVIGGAALIQQGALWRPLAIAVLAAWVLARLMLRLSSDTTWPPLRALSSQDSAGRTRPSRGFLSNSFP